MNRVTLIGKPDCHLCDEARKVVARVCEEFGAQWQERSILSDPDLADLYWELIPVVLVDGAQIAHWHVAPDVLRSALAGQKGR